MTSNFTRLIGAAAVAGLTLAALAAASPADATRTGVSPAADNGRFYGVAALSATDAWAVGLHPGELIAHWDGTSWTQSLSGKYFLFGVAASGPSDVWAAGGTNWFNAKTVIDHWDGTAWTRVPTPSPGKNSYFRSVATTSANDAWAVGLTNSSPGNQLTAGTKTLAEHWNGTAWAKVPSPNPRVISGLQGVTAISPTDAWAVGFATRVNGPSGDMRALILHWDGTSWTKATIPNPAHVSTDLSSVAATSANDVWAVGQSHIFGHNQTYVLHWNGTAWTQVPSPNPPSGGVLEAVTALSPTDAWATGRSSQHANSCTHCRTLAEHWDGTTWTIVPTPTQPDIYLDDLLSVSGTASNDVWAAGTIGYNGTQLEHWNGTAWTTVTSPQYQRPRAR